MRVTIAPTWALSARPLPETAALTSLGVCSAIGRPRRAAATIAIPLAWAVPMIVLESERAKTRSIATASGWCSSSQASMPRSMWTSRSETCWSAEVRSTLTSTSRSGRPTLPSTTPMPQRVSPGSIPSTRMSLALRPNTCSYVTLAGAAAGTAYDTREVALRASSPRRSLRWVARASSAQPVLAQASSSARTSSGTSTLVKTFWTSSRSSSASTRRKTLPAASASTGMSMLATNCTSAES